MFLKGLQLQSSSPVGKLGVAFIRWGLLLAGSSGLVFMINLFCQTQSWKIDPAIWGQFGDFLGGTWGVLLTAGSALLIIETIRKQDEHEQIRSFEARLLVHLKAYQDKKRFEVIELKTSARLLMANFKRIIPPNFNEGQRMEYSYYLTFGKALSGLPMTTEQILTKIRYQGVELTTSQILNEEVELQYSPTSENSHLDLLLLILEIYKTINLEAGLNFENKLKYGGLIRLMLSEEELILISVFSFTYSGRDFEQTGSQVFNCDLRLITKYSIIRNLAVNHFGSGVLQKLFEDIQFDWMESEPESRKSLKFT